MFLYVVKHNTTQHNKKQHDTFFQHYFPKVTIANMCMYMEEIVLFEKDTKIGAIAIHLCYITSESIVCLTLTSHVDVKKMAYFHPP